MRTMPKAHMSLGNGLYGFMAVISPIHSAGGTKVSDCNVCEQKAALTRTHVDVCVTAEIAHHLLIRSKTKVCQEKLGAILVGQDVLRLEIPVGDLCVVACLDGVHKREKRRSEKLVVV